MRSNKNSPRQQGFSLIELLIVVAIIGTIAAIALPNYMESRHAAHNASAISSLRLIHTSEASYRAAHDQYTDLTTLGSTGYLVDPLLINGTRSNYKFTIGAVNTDFYEITAAPAIAPWRYYYMDVSGVIRAQLGAAADGNSPPISY